MPLYRNRMRFSSGINSPSMEETLSANRRTDSDFADSTTDGPKRRLPRHSVALVDGLASGKVPRRACGDPPLRGKGSKPATMPLAVPVLRVLEACRGERTDGPLVLRPVSGKPIDRRDCYRMVTRIAKAAAIPRHISPHSLRHAAIINALDAGVPLRDAQILARHADPRTTEHYDRARGNLDRNGVHFLTAYVAGV